jgi:hypothetical protein
MLRRMVILTVALAFSAALAFADDTVKDDKTKGKVTIEPSSLNVSRKLDENNFGLFSTDSTRIEILVNAPGKYLIGVDKSSKLTTFADDKGNSLINDKDFSRPNFANFPRYGKDRTSMLLSLSSFSRAPVKGATKVVVKGDLVVVSGLEEKTTEATKVEFKDKSETKIGDFKLRVNREKSFEGSGPAIQLTGKLRGIKGITVLGDDGKEVEVFAGGSTSGDENHTHYYNIRKPLKEGKVKVTYFSKEELIKVPVDLAIGAGL